MSNEAILLNFLHYISFMQTAVNAIGATTDQSLRTVPTPGGDIAYVRKYGVIYGITDITDVTIPGGTTTGVKEGIRYTFKGMTSGTTLGYVEDHDGVVGAWQDDSTISADDGVLIEIYCTEDAGGNVPSAPALLVDTDVDAGGLTVALSVEQSTETDDAVTVYVSDTGSTYYSSDYHRGGARHTPALNNSRKPYSDIAAAYAALAAANDDGIEILDSEVYEDVQDLDNSSFTVYSSSGQTPTWKRSIGARTTREPTTVFNNSNAVFFNENGDNVAADAYSSWQKPYADVSTAVTNRGARTYIIYGGSGAAGGTMSESSSLTMTAALTIEPEDGFAPTFYYTAAFCLQANGVAITIKGFNFLGTAGNTLCNTTGNNSSFVLNDCTARGFAQVKYEDTHTTCAFTSTRCLYKNCYSVVQLNGTGAAANTYTISMTYNYIHNSYYTIKALVANGCTLAITFQHNVINGGLLGIQMANVAAANTTLTMTSNNNTLFDIEQFGIVLSKQGGAIAVGASTIDAYIFYDCVYGIYSDSAITVNYNTFYNCDDKYNGNVTSINNELTTDPLICDKANELYGIDIASPAYRSAAASADRGAIFNHCAIGANSVVINGLIFDMDNIYFKPIYTTATRTGMDIHWCTIRNCGGSVLDIYATGVLDSEIKNCVFENSGAGIYFRYGTNTIEQTIIYNTGTYAIYLDYYSNTLDHVVTYGTDYGVYVGGNTYGMENSNCIFHSYYYSCYSTTAKIYLSYTCYTGALYNFIDDSEIGHNVNGDPNFIDETSGSEDFHIKTTETDYTDSDGNVIGQYPFDSPCKEAGDDGYDIGAYLVTRARTSDTWSLLSMAENPHVITWKQIVKGLRQSENVEGRQSNFGKGHKKVFVFDFPSGGYFSQETRETMEFLASLVPTRENNYVDERCKIRFSPLPSAGIDSGSSSTIDATEKTFTNSGDPWYRNALKGYHIAQIFESGSESGTVTASTKKIAVSPSPTWTDDEWIGYYCYFQNNFWYITANDADELTLSDPDGLLSNESDIDWSIEKYFKIEKNDSTSLTVTDDDSELISGSYDYIIRFIECFISKFDFNYSQKRYYWEQETWKNGFRLEIEEL